MKTLKTLLTGIALLTVSVLMLTTSVSAQVTGDIDTTSSCLNLSYNLKFRMRDAQVNGEVSDLQDFLADNDYLTDTNRGYFGSKTVAAVKAFQRANSLLASGYVGPMTRGKIGVVSCNNTNIIPANPSVSDSNGPVITNVYFKKNDQGYDDRAQVIVEGIGLSKAKYLNWTWSTTDNRVVTGNLTDMDAPSTDTKLVFRVYQYKNLLEKLKLTDLSRSSLFVNVQNEFINNYSNSSLSYKVDLNSLIINKDMKMVILKTSMGDIEIELNYEKTPKTVANFAKLVGEKYYDGIRFHRVIKDFIIQAGDPLSRDLARKELWGTGGPGYKFVDELSGNEKYPVGTVAMANSGPNTNGSQFFIVTGQSASSLPALYTVFGKVTKGLDTALKINELQTDTSEKPIKDVIIESVILKYF